MKPITPLTSFPEFANINPGVAPGEPKYSQGFVPADTFPAEWANYLFNRSSKGITALNSAVDSIWAELESILTYYGITPDGTDNAQILEALKKIPAHFTTCSTAANTQNKSIAVQDDVLKAGNVYVIEMTYGNTYGDGSATYPTLSINSGTAYPMCDSCGRYLKSGAWAAGDTVTVIFTGTKFITNAMVTDKIETGNLQAVTSNAVACRTTANQSVTGPALGEGGTIRVMFTAAITGSDTTTGFALSYNGTSKAVKVYKDGILANFTAAKTSWLETTAVYKYLDAGTMLELMYDGTQFIILGNPVVLKSSQYSIRADGSVDGGAIGDIKPTSLMTIPYGWLECDGSAKSRQEFAKLFEFYSTQLYDSDNTHTLLSRYGIGDGTTTFNLPDYREVALVGAGQNGTEGASLATHDVYTVGQFKDDCFQNHGHTKYWINDSGVAINNDYPGAFNFQNQSSSVVHNGASGRAGTVTRGKSKGVKYIIKVL